LTTE
jgi:hypothetical protein